MLVWSNGRPVLADDRVHAFHPDMSGSYGAFHSVYDYLTESAPATINMHPDHVWRTQPWVRTVVDFLAGEVAQVRIGAYGRDADDSRRRVDSPLSRLMQRPNGRQATGYEWRSALVIDRALWGRYAALVVNTDSRRRDDSWRIKRLPPRDWSYIRNALDEPVAIFHHRAETIYDLERSNVVWFDGYPSAERSPLETMRSVLLEEIEAGNARRDLWQNRARIPGVITRPADAAKWVPESRDAFKQSWQEFSATGTKTGKTPVLEDGMQYHTIDTVSSSDAQGIEARQLGRREVAAFFHVASQLVGDSEGTNYSNVTAYREMLYTATLGRWFLSTEEGLNDRLVPIIAPAGDEYLEFKVKSKLRLAFDKQAAANRSAVGTPYMTINEVRKLDNLPPVPGGEEVTKYPNNTAATEPNPQPGSEEG